MSMQTNTSDPSISRTACPRCGTFGLKRVKKDSFKVTCPACNQTWNLDIMRCPICSIFLSQEKPREKYKCFSCGFTPMEEKDLREKVKQYYIGQGYDVVWESFHNGPGADLILHQKTTHCVVVIEAKGEDPSQINGLAGVQKALGQIVEHIDNPQGTNAGILESLVDSGTTFMYAVAVPCTQRYLTWCSARIGQSARQKLDLHWIFVERDGQVNIVDPYHLITEVISI